MQVTFVDTVLVTYFIYAMTGWNDVRTTLVSILLLSFYWWFWQAILAKPMQKITEGKEMTIGHQLVVGSWLVIWIAKIFKDKSIGHEDLPNENKQPQWFDLLKDPIISYSLIMGLIYLIVGLLS